jgi:hypothetical protein
MFKVARATCYGHEGDLRPFPDTDPFAFDNPYPYHGGFPFTLLWLDDAVAIVHFDVNLPFFA